MSFVPEIKVLFVSEIKVLFVAQKLYEIREEVKANQADLKRLLDRVRILKIFSSF